MLSNYTTINYYLHATITHTLMYKANTYLDETPRHVQEARGRRKVIASSTVVRLNGGHSRAPEAVAICVLAAQERSTCALIV